MAYSSSSFPNNLSDHFIGNFRDIRLARVGARLFKGLCEKMITCIKSLGDNRSGEIAFHRFLENKKVSIDIIDQSLANRSNEACYGKSHVLCLQDTVQLTFPTQPEKKKNFGPTGDADTNGLFVHPGIIVDAKNKNVLGTSGIAAWYRNSESNQKKVKNRPIEEKESIRWINTALKSKEQITSVDKITVVADRESDILEIFDRIPDDRTDLIIRASHDRKLEDNSKISEVLNKTPVVSQHQIDLPAITGKRKARKALLDIKYTSLSLYDKKNDKSLQINCVSALEKSPVPKGESPISWVLLTTHRIQSSEKAIQILTWYTWRWIIEQLFRTMKKQGLKIEDSQIENPEKLKKLAVLAIAAAIKIMALVQARDGNTKQQSADFFTESEITVLTLICLKISGKTKKQQNPFAKKSLAWASWIIARLGGWNGYRKNNPPGPITMLNGLKLFTAQYQGWLLAQENVCIG